MKCPICDRAMLEGGLIIDGISSGWVPMEQFHKKGIQRIIYTGLRTIGTPNVFLNQTKVPNAFFCESCNKVIGIFDVTNNSDK